MLDNIAQIASIFGVGLQSFEFVDRLVKSTKDSDALKLLYLMETPTKSWKTIHLAYCNLRPSTDKIYTATHLANGKVKKTVSPNDLQIVFQDSNIYNAIYNFKSSLSVAINNIEMSFCGNDIISKINKVNNEKIRFALEEIRDSKDRAMVVHTDACKFFDDISKFVDNKTWNDSDVGYILNARKLYKNRLRKHD